MDRRNDRAVYPEWWTGRDRYLYDNGPDDDTPPEYPWRGDEFWEWPGPNP